MHGAEEVKQDAMLANAAAKERASAGTYHPSQCAPGIVPAGGHVDDGMAESRPVGTATGTGRPSAAHNPHVGGGSAQAPGTGGQYQSDLRTTAIYARVCNWFRCIGVAEQ